MIITLKNIILIILTIFTFISILLFINHELIIINNNNINNKGNYDIDHHGNIIFRIVEEGFKLAPRGILMKSYEKISVFEKNTLDFLKQRIDQNIHINKDNCNHSSSNIDPVINIETVEVENSNSNNEYVLFDTAHGENSNITENSSHSKHIEKKGLFVMVLLLIVRLFIGKLFKVIMSMKVLSHRITVSITTVTYPLNTIMVFGIMYEWD